MLNFFPSLVIHLILLSGVLLFLASSFLAMIPFINQYKIPGQILGAILAAIGLFYEGGLSYKEKMDKEFANMKIQMEKFKGLSESQNVTIEHLLNKKIDVIHDKGNTIIKYLETDGRKYDKACTIPQEIIDAHNRAATLEDDTSESDIVLPPRTSK